MLVIGLDIGGTKIHGILWNGKRVVQAHEVPTPQDQNRFEETLVALVNLLRGRREIEGIGIGAAGIIEKTTLIFSPNIPYIKGFDFRPFSAGSGRVRVDNDARCFARAEFLKGAGRGAKSLFALTIGTGIGRAYGKNGKIIKLKRFEYPERWERRYQAIRDLRDNDRLIEFLSQRLVPLMMPFRPEVVVIGGGVLERHGFLPRLRRAFATHGLKSKIRRSRLGKNAVAVGAALLFD